MSRKKKTAAIVWSVVVVGGILLCLGAIATPKFGGFGAKCKSHQSEAKTNLSGIFTAEKAFFGEYGFYTTDLNAVDWRPDGSPVYAYGFTFPSEKASDPQIADLDPTRRTTLDVRVVGDGRYGTGKMMTRGDQPRPLADEDFQRHARLATATSNTFLAFAIGDIDDGGDEKLDVWSIDHEKTLRSISNDCYD